MGATQAPGSEPLTGETLTPAPPRATACLNCGASLTGPFCAACGQRDIPPYPSVRELVIDAFWELSGWDGRFAATARALVRRPGMLTREFLEGRRARYISPLRLYLTCSLVYFVLAAAAPDVRLESGQSVLDGMQVNITRTDSSLSRPERIAAAAEGTFERGETLTPAQRDSMLVAIGYAPALLQPVMRRGVEDPVGLKRGVIEAAPRMLFALLPVFAAILALFYRGRKYPEHLYFATHLHAFVFLALLFIELTKFTRSPAVAIGASIVALPSIPVYATLAFRRVYGGPLARTIVKELAIAAIYGVVCLSAFVLMVYWVSILG